MFAVYFPSEKKYGRFSFYSKVTLVDAPEKATLMSRERCALRRKHEINNATGGIAGAYIKNRPYWNKVEVHKLKFTSKVIRSL
jgi:hypothetical protein